MADHLFSGRGEKTMRERLAGELLDALITPGLQ